MIIYMHPSPVASLIYYLLTRPSPFESNYDILQTIVIFFLPAAHYDQKQF